MGKLDTIGICVVVGLLVVIIFVSFFDGTEGGNAAPGNGNGEQQNTASTDDPTTGTDGHRSLSSTINAARGNGEGTRKVSSLELTTEDDDANDPLSKNGSDPVNDRDPIKTDDPVKSRRESTPPAPSNDKDFAGFPKKGVLGEGQQLWNVIVKVYGSRIGPNMIDRVLAASGIQDDTRVRAGAELVFPAPPASLLARLDKRSGAKKTSSSSTKEKAAAAPTRRPTSTRRRFLWEPEEAEAIGAIVERSVGAGEYRVKRGETLSEIAEKQLGSSRRWKEIMKLNGLSKPESVKAGDVIKLPAR